MRCAIIEAGSVINVADAPSAEFAQARGWVASDAAQIGDSWDGNTFTTPAPVATVPEEVTMRQARLALLAAGKLAAVDAAIASLPSPTKEAAEIEWAYSSTVRRNQPLVLALAPALGLDSAALDALFVQAAAL